VNDLLSATEADNAVHIVRPYRAAENVFVFIQLTPRDSFVLLVNIRRELDVARNDHCLALVPDVCRIDVFTVARPRSPWQRPTPSRTEGVVMGERKTITVPEAGREYFNLGRNASYEAARRGEIPTIRIGRLLRVPVVALERKLEEAGTSAH
jgi:hypothetical protein